MSDQKSAPSDDMAGNDVAANVRIYVCTTCTGSVADGAPSAAELDEAGQDRPGLTLYRALCAHMTKVAPDMVVDVHPVTCLSNCEQGCSVAIADPGKWGYLLGGVGPETADDLARYACAYARSKTGTVLRRRRPQSLRHAIIARFPVPALDGEEEAFLKRTVTNNEAAPTGNHMKAEK